MIRLKINLVIVLALAAFCVAVLLLERQDPVPSGRQNLQLAAEAFLRARRLQEVGQDAIALEISSYPGLVQAMANGEPQGMEGRRQRQEQVWPILESWKNRLATVVQEDEEDLASSGGVDRRTEEQVLVVPTLMLSFDARGEAVANADDHRWFSRNLRERFPILEDVQKTLAPVRDLWLFEGHILDVVVSPITSPRGEFLGSVVLGFPFHDGLASRYAQILGHEVIFQHNNKVKGSSLADLAAAKEVAGKMEEANIWNGGPVPAGTIGAQDRSFRIMPIRLAGTRSSAGVVGVLLLGDETSRMEASAHFQFLVFGAAALLSLLALLLSSAFLSRHIRSLEAIEAGIHEVSGGNSRYVFPHHEGRKGVVDNLAEALNILLYNQRKERDGLPTEGDGATSDKRESEPVRFEERDSGPPAADRSAGGEPGRDPGKPTDSERRGEALHATLTALSASLVTPPEEEVPAPSEGDPTSGGQAAEEDAGDEAAGAAVTLPEPVVRPEVTPTVVDESTGSAGESPAQDQEATAVPHDLAGGSGSAPVDPAQEEASGPVHGDNEAGYQALFEQYVQAKRDNGEDVSKITYERFRVKLQDNEDRLKERLGVQHIEFRVQTKAGKVSLKPIAHG